MKILLYDIETVPNIVSSWTTSGKNWRAIEVVEEWYMLCFAYKWLGQKKIHTVALPDFKGYPKNKQNDKNILEVLWKLLDEAEIVIAQNGDAFDQKKSNARFIAHGMKPPSPYKTIDTLKVARRYFKFNSNKLDDLGNYLGVGRKVNTGGFSLWKGCMEGDEKSWRLMRNYNKQDVQLLEDVYLKLRPWMTNHPNRTLLDNKTKACPNCSSEKLQKRGFATTRVSKYQRWCCQDCGAWSRSRTSEVIVKPEIL